MTKYNVYLAENTINRNYRNLSALKDVREGFTMNQDGDIFNEIVSAYDTEDEARADLAKRKTTIDQYSYIVTTYKVQEYYIEVDEVDEDGEVIEWGDILEMTPMIFKVYDEETNEFLYETDNLYDAEQNDHENGTYWEVA